MQISHWNVRSFSCQEKVTYVEELPGDILGLQEIWKPSNLLIDTLGLFSNLRDSNRGGGVGLMLKEGRFTVLEEVLKIEDILIVKILIKPKSYFFMGTCYISPNNPNSFRNLMQLLYQNASHSLISRLILVGDFNRPLGSCDPEILSLSKKIGVKPVQPSLPTRQNAYLDILFHGEDVEIIDSLTIPSPSDHKAVTWFLKIYHPTKSTRTLYKLPNKKLQDIFSLQVLQDDLPLLSSLSNTLTSWQRLGSRRFVKPKKPKLWSNFLDYITSNDHLSFKELEKLYWENLINEMLHNRSKDPKRFFSFLKKVYKYNSERREGSIISRLMSDNNCIIADKESVDHALADVIREIQIDQLWPSLARIPFPCLPALNEEYLLQLLDLLHDGKASAWDPFSDIWFNNEFRWLTASRMCCLWSIPLDNVKHFDKIFQYRLVPLNKKHPKIGTKYDMRPICVGSAMIKLLELPFLPCLTDYLNSRMSKHQIGFVPHMEVNVNIWRAVDEIHHFNEKNGFCYALFLDLKQAYNSVPHYLLFQRLAQKNVLPPLHLKFLCALYSRLSIKVGNETIRPNKGVAQGSILSPALFDIFIEDLIQSLSNLCPRINQILAYADDLLIICPDLFMLSKVINAVEFWVRSNGMSLNKQKSGIMLMTKRYSRMKNSMTAFSGIPFVESYKYLGTLFTPKLLLQPAAKMLFVSLTKTQKSLHPVLHKADIKTRWYLWRIFVESKLKACSILYHFETSFSSRNWFIGRLKGSLKEFLGIKVTANDEWVNWLFDSEAEKLRLGTYFDTAIVKWGIRTDQQISFCMRRPPSLKRNLFKYISPKIIQLINLFTVQCPSCSRARLFPNHIQKHKLECPSIQSIIQEIEEALSQAQASKMRIFEITEEIGEKYLLKLRMLLNSIHSES